MPTTHPPDQFDEPPANSNRIGVHRAPVRRGHRWIAFAWAALATGVLVAAGVVFFAVSTSSDDSDLGTTPATSTPVPTAEPVTDPTTIDPDRKITITVLNATTKTGLEDVAEETLLDDDWPVTAATEADLDTLAETVVYYSDAANEDVARGVALALGFDTVEISDALLGASVTVVLGADYADAQ